jgi:hypothetical protein
MKRPSHRGRPLHLPVVESVIRVRTSSS